MRLNRIFPLFVFLALLFCLPLSAYKPNGPRDYSQPASQEEVAKIRYVVSTLGDHEKAYVICRAIKLNRYGGDIDHVHPLRFLETIFSDDHMKVQIRNIKKKSWAWHGMGGGFIGGVRRGCSEEHAHRNMRDEDIADFARNVSVNVELVRKPIKACDWDGLVNTLMTHCPRSGDAKKYDF